MILFFLPSHRVFILQNCNVTILGWMYIYSINLTPFNFTPFSLLPIGYFPASLLHFSQPSLQLLTLPLLIRSFYVQIMLHLAPLGSTFTPLGCLISSFYVQIVLHLAPQSCLTNLTLLGTKLKGFEAS